MTGSAHFSASVHPGKLVYFVILMMPAHQIPVMKEQFAKQVLSTAPIFVLVHPDSRARIAPKTLMSVWMAPHVNMEEVALTLQVHSDVNVRGDSRDHDVRST